MTTTPTPWLPASTANYTAGEGWRTVKQAIGIKKNGNILVVWEDNTNGSSPSTDVMGQLFDPHGTPIGLAFQVNTDVVASDETGPQIVALPDGGYVIAYGSSQAKRSAASSGSSGMPPTERCCSATSSPTRIQA